DGHVTGVQTCALPISPFASPARAQFWFEWRRHGWSLPALVGILLPFELALLFIPYGPQALVLVAALFTPPFMALFAAATVRKSGDRKSTRLNSSHVAI